MKSHRVVNLKVRLIGDATMSFQNIPGEKSPSREKSPFRDPCTGIIFQAEIVGMCQQSHVYETRLTSLPSYGRHVGLHVVVTIKFPENTTNPSKREPMINGWECYVTGNFKEILTRDREFAAYYIIEAKSVGFIKLNTMCAF